MPPLIFTARPRSTPFFPTIFGVISSRPTIFPSSSYVRANVSSAWSRSSPPFILLKNVIYRRISRHRFHKGGGGGLTLCMQASQNRSSKCAGTKLLLILILSFLSRRSSDIRENLLGHIPDELTSSGWRENIYRRITGKGDKSVNILIWYSIAQIVLSIIPEFTI